MRVAVTGFEDAGFSVHLKERGAAVCEPVEGDLDLLFAMVHGPGDLHRLSELRRQIKDGGAIWVVRAKGAAAKVREVDVIEAGKAHRLVDNKIASFSGTLAAMRLVIPLAMRGDARRRVRG